MKLSYEGTKDKASYEKAGIKLPAYDWQEMRDATMKAPVWVHFGAGNIFRGFIAGLQNTLLNQGLADRGIVAAETFDYGIIDKIYVPHDSMTLMVTLESSGHGSREVISSIARGIKADSSDREEWNTLQDVFCAKSLQMVSFTITEKGYQVKDAAGNMTKQVQEDIAAGPDNVHHGLSVVAAMMLARYQAGAYPIALVSMDNCSRNGEKLRQGMLTIIRGWVENEYVPEDFLAYMEDESRVSFPWTMIDKITPRPAESVEKQLLDAGMEDMDIVVTDRRTYIAPFVNAEAPQYLVIEDRFPNGRPALEKAGVYMTDRNTVSATERMKVTTCLNPLHTALAVYGCLLGYNLIADEMQDADLVKLVKTIGYKEGLPVVTDPGIISPRNFIDEVVTKRLPNPCLPDTPQRIATDTSQKLAIRFGETIRSYMENPSLDSSSLTAIPLAIAGWLRYLAAVDDEGREMSLSADPMMEELQTAMKGITLGSPDSVGDKLHSLLSNSHVFGVNLYEAGLAEKVTEYLKMELAGVGAVRSTLEAVLSE